LVKHYLGRKFSGPSALGEGAISVGPGSSRDDADTANHREERNDNAVTDAVPNLVVIHAQTEGLYQAERAMGQELRADPEVDAGPACNAACDSFTVEPSTSNAEIPAWVKALPAFQQRQADGEESDTVTYFSDDPLTIRAATEADCGDRRVCLFQHAGFRGRMLQGQGDNRRYDLGGYNFGNIASSAINRGRRNCAEMTGYKGFFQLPARHQTGNLGRFNDGIDELIISTNSC